MFFCWPDQALIYAELSKVVMYRKFITTIRVLDFNKISNLQFYRPRICYFQDTCSN